jgi:hypothetical protein
MKISLKDLRPNPFRDIAHYPILREKLEALKASIRATGFWDNVVVRKPEKGEHFEIAYGQHRLEALKELVAEKIIEEDMDLDLPVRKLDDATMIQIMANENMNEYRPTAEIVDETIRVAREFLAKQTQTPMMELTASDISQFLGGAYSEDKVTVSLQRLGLFDRGMLERDQIKGLSHTAARGIQREVAKVEKVMVKKQLQGISNEEEPTNQERKRVRAQVQKVANHVAESLSKHVRDGGSLGEIRERAIDAQVEMIPDDAKPSDRILSTIDAAAHSVSAREFKRKVEMIAKYREFMTPDAREDLIAHLKELSTWCKNTAALFETA